MEISEIKNLNRKDSPLDYRKEFTVTLVCEFAGLKKEYPCEFLVEYKPLGKPDIHISFPSNPDYPLVPLLRAVRPALENLYVMGRLN